MSESASLRKKMRGPRKSKNADLPPRLHKKGETYWHVGSTLPRKWTCLGRDLSDALVTWAELEKNLPELVNEYHLPANWIKKMYERANLSAKRRKIRFDLTSEQLQMLVTESRLRCAITGKSFDFSGYGSGRQPWGPSLDRIDSNLGYTFENCRLVCLAVNYAMNQWGSDVLLEMCRAMVRSGLVSRDEAA